MRIVIGWTKISGYAAAGWRALAHRSGIDFSVIVSAPKGLFDESLLEGIPHLLLDSADLYEGRATEQVREHIKSFDPDLITIAGWFVKSYRPLIPDLRRREKTRLCMTMDNPYTGSLRQRVGMFWARRYLRQFDGMFVAGANAADYARRLDMPADRIHQGLYCGDVAGLSSLYEERLNQPGGWPRRFVYMGRYSAEKGIEPLLGAYAKYREAVTEPWPLDVCGAGPLESIWRGQPGITDHGFVQPAEQKKIWLDAGAMLFPSTYEPWGVAALEAAAAGLPIVCSDACGAAMEILTPGYNGLSCRAGDIHSLADCLVWLHENHDELPQMGSRGVEAAQPFDGEHWAEKMGAVAQDLCSRPKR